MERSKHTNVLVRMPCRAVAASLLAAVSASGVAALTAAATPTSVASPSPAATAAVTLTPSPTSTPEPTPIPAGSITVRVTLIVEVSPEGWFAEVPTGSRMRVQSEVGTCLEVPLPADVTSALEGGGEARLPDIVIPPGAIQPGCGQELSVEVVRPDDSYWVVAGLSRDSPLPSLLEITYRMPGPVPIPHRRGGVEALPRTGQGSFLPAGVPWGGAALAASWRSREASP